MKEHRNESKNRRWFLKTIGAVSLGFVATTLTDSAGLPQSLESRRELELQNLEWYKKWLAEGRSVRLVDEQADIAELESVRLVDLDFTQGLTCIDSPSTYVEQVPNIIQNFQKDSLVELIWLAPIGEGWTVTVNRYVNLANLDSKYHYLKQKIIKPFDYQNLLEDWSDKSIVTLSKTIGDCEIAWSISNKGGQSNPLLQGGKVERGDYSLLITSTKTGKVIVAAGFASRLIKSGLDVQHAFKNIGLHPLKRYSVPETGKTMSYFEFGSLHPPGNFPLANQDHLASPLDEKQVNVLIAAILAFVNNAISPQVAITMV